MITAQDALLEFEEPGIAKQFHPDRRKYDCNIKSHPSAGKKEREKKVNATRRAKLGV